MGRDQAPQRVRIRVCRIENRRLVPVAGASKERPVVLMRERPRWFASSPIRGACDGIETGPTRGPAVRASGRGPCGRRGTSPIPSWRPTSGVTTLSGIGSCTGGSTGPRRGSRCTSLRRRSTRAGSCTTSRVAGAARRGRSRVTSRRRARTAGTSSCRTRATPDRTPRTSLARSITTARAWRRRGQAGVIAVGDLRRGATPWLSVGRQRRSQPHHRDPRARARPVPGRSRVHPPARRSAGAGRGGRRTRRAVGPEALDKRAIDVTTGGSGDPFAGLYVGAARRPRRRSTVSASRAGPRTRSTRCRSCSTAWFPGSVDFDPGVLRRLLDGTRIRGHERRACSGVADPGRPARVHVC